MNYGKKLKNLRKQSGLSANALARQVSLDPTTIYKIEANVSKPSLDALERICLVLGISMSDFFSAADTGSPLKNTPLNGNDISSEDLKFLRSFRRLSLKKQKAIEILVLDEEDMPEEENPVYGL